jgi:hypothetical protein
MRLEGARGGTGGQVPPAPTLGSHGASGSCRGRAWHTGAGTGQVRRREQVGPDSLSGPEMTRAAQQGKTDFSFLFFNPN